jgi:hypothetical protein
MKRAVSGASCVVAFTVVVLSAQDKNMSTNKMDHMSIEKTYSGCLESSRAGIYSLTHVTVVAEKSISKRDPVAKADAMKKDDAMNKGMMMPASLSLSAAAKDLNKYVGHRVRVTGSDDSMNGMTTFKVRSLKTIAKSCA